MEIVGEGPPWRRDPADEAGLREQWDPLAVEQGLWALELRGKEGEPGEANGDRETQGCPPG